MHLSRMYLNERLRQTKRLLANPQAMHAAVLAAFPPGREDRVLWRIDRDGHRTALIVVSGSVPSFEHLQEQAGWRNEPSWETRDYDRLLDRLQRGQEYAFRLVANPAGIRSYDDGRKRRVVHRSVPHQRRWLLERAERIGVEFLPAGPEAEPEILVSARSTLRFPRNDRTVTLGQARFEGALRIVEVDALRTALVEGIGRGKAYGNGLMTLASVRRS